VSFLSGEAGKAQHGTRHVGDICLNVKKRREEKRREEKRREEKRRGVSWI
jgi:hypothetical protein